MAEKPLAWAEKQEELECEPMHNVIAAQPNIYWRRLRKFR